MESRYNQTGTIFSSRRTTKEQDKKHRSMMTEEELTYLSDWAKKRPVKDLIISSHFLGKGSVTVNPWHIKWVMEKDNLSELIIEFNKRYSKYGDSFTQRILIRDDEEEIVTLEDRFGRKFESRAHLCFVVDLTTWTLITAYWNKSSDDHRTMDWSYYNKDLQITKREA